MPDLLLRRCLLDHAPGAAPVDLRIRAGTIAQIAPRLEPTPGERVLEAAGRLLIPGLIDLHIHGAGGADVLDGTEEALRTISRTLARLGVTGFLATTVARPDTDDAHLAVAGALAGRDLGGARLLGLHLEGPFVNPARRGGLPPESLYPLADGALERLLERCGGALRMLTVAPELPGALAAVRRLRDAGVIPSFGHSDATYEQTRAGFDAGIRHVTHLYNAMPGLHHRAPGPLLAILEDPGVTAQLIADDVHVDRRMVRWTRSVLGPERCVCITDGMRTVGLPDGRYNFGGRDFESRDGAARYLDGTLIGTSLGLLEIARRFQAFTGCAWSEAIASASARPARVLGRAAGVVEAGHVADLVLLQPDRSVWATLVGGRLVHGGEGALDTAS